MSVNRLYWDQIVKNRHFKGSPASPKAWMAIRRLSYDAMPYKDNIRAVMELFDKEFYGSEKLVVDTDTQMLNLGLYYFLADYFLVDGKSIKRHDTTNFTKALEDAISEYLGVDDRYYGRVDAEKFPSDGDFIIVVLTVVEKPSHVDSSQITALVERNLFTRQSVDCIYRSKSN